MKKSLKALLLVLAAALLFALAASGCAKKAPEAPVSPSPSADPSPSASVSPSEAPSPSASPVVSPSESPDERTDSSTLTFSVEGQSVTENATLIEADFGTGIRGFGYSIYCLSDSFEYEPRDGSDLISSTLLDNCSLELRYIEGHTVESAIPAFLDDYLHYTDIEYTGDYNIAGTLYAQGAVASNGSETYAAYLADADGGILAFVLRCPNEALEGQMLRLYAMLDSFQFNY